VQLLRHDLAQRGIRASIPAAVVRDSRVL